jgi:type VI secretion system Hcp family effector
MPTPCYISIEGKTQGNITAGAFTSDSVGNIFVQGHEDEMLVQEYRLTRNPVSLPVSVSTSRSSSPLH